MFQFAWRHRPAVFTCFRYTPRLTAPIFIFWLLLGFWIASPVAFGQYTPDYALGLRPYDYLSGGNIDSISLTNGNLIFHVPLLSYPQRGGKLKMDFFIRYNDKNWILITLKEICGRRPCQQWEWVGNGVGITKDQTITSNIPTLLVSGPGSAIQFAVTADGAAHEMGATTPQQLVFCGQNVCATYGTWETLDGSGIRYESNASGTEYIDRDGIRYVPGSNVPGSYAEDANGNRITESSTGWTDTLGRFIPDTVQTTGTAGCPAGATSATLWSPPEPSGYATPYKSCYESFSFSTPPSWSNGQTIFAGTANVTELVGIILPNQQSWQFTYLSTGSLASVVLPTGATISYGWTGLDDISVCEQHQTLAVGSRTVNLNDGSQPSVWTYSYRLSVNGSTADLKTDPLGNDTLYYLGVAGTGTCRSYVTRTQLFEGAYTVGNLVKTVDTDYGGENDPNAGWVYGTINAVPIKITTTWPNGKVSQVQKSYDSGHTYLWYNFGAPGWPTTSYPLVYGSVVQESHYDYGQNAPDPLLRQTNTSYVWQTNTNYLNFNLLNLASNVSIYDGSSNLKAATNYSYDSSSPLASGISTQHDPSPPNAPYKGNQNLISRWLNTTNSYLTTTNTFYDTGEVQQTADPNGNATTYTYSLNFAGAYPTQIQYPTTNSVQHIVTYNYDSELPPKFAQWIIRRLSLLNS